MERDGGVSSEPPVDLLQSATIILKAYILHTEAFAPLPIP
jgi:hypothetical protein